MSLDQPEASAAGPPTTDAATVNALARRRMRLVTMLSTLVCLVFFPLPVLGQFTDVLDGLVGGGLTWAWIYAIAQFPVALAAAAWYASRARSLDESADVVRQGR